MHIISVQSLAGGTGVSLTAAELALKAAAQGRRVLAVDTCLQKALSRDLDPAGFHVIEDVRALFWPLERGRWGLRPMPHRALLCLPFNEPSFISSEEHHARVQVFERLAGEALGAATNLVQTIAELAPLFDVMVVDVQNKNKELMQMFHDVSHEAHVLLRSIPGGAATLEQWRAYIDRTEGTAAGPRVVTGSDRGRTEHTRDWYGRSSVLAELYEAA
jgi:cellulose biosynthesis protein BcsQ